MKRTLGAVLAATVAVGALAAPIFASAQDYPPPPPADRGYDNDRAPDNDRNYDNGRNPCQEAKHDGSTGGAILGALAGAAIGSNIGGHGARTEGAVVGGVAGAVVGSNVGRAGASNSAACDDRGYYDENREYHTYGQAYYYDDGFYDPRGVWVVYGPGRDRFYYQRMYGKGFYSHRFFHARPYRHHHGRW